MKTRLNKYLMVVFFLAACDSGFTSCNSNSSDDSDDTGEVALPTGTIIPAVGSTTTTITAADRANLLPSRLRLVPEQSSLKSEANTGMECIYNQALQREVCQQLENLWLPLGGVDYFTVFARDPSTRVNTILYYRNILESKIFSESLDARSQRDDPSQWTYDEANLWQFADPLDRSIAPSSDSNTAGSQAWYQQLDHLFWRFFARPPSQAEIDLLVGLYNEAAQDPDPNARPWGEVLYVLMMSIEYWHY